MDFKFGIVFGIFCCISAATNQTGEDRLYTHLFTDYNKFIRPGGDSGTTVNVNLLVALHQLTFLNSESQAIQNLVVITADWEDKKLMWRPSLYGNVTYIVLPASQIWLPDFGVENSADKFYDISSENFRLLINHTGHITWSFGGHVTTKCKIIVDKFPFDEQECDFSLMNWMYDKRAVNLTLRQDSMDLDEYISNVEWRLTATKCERNTVTHKDRDGRDYPSIRCKMLVCRRPTFYVINLFVPSYLILVLLLVSFCLPPGHRAVVPLQITTLLLYFVLLLTISKDLPHTSRIPHISVFALVVSAMSTLSVALTVGISVIRMYMDTSLRVPSIVRKLAFNYLARPLCLKTLAQDVYAIGVSIETGRAIQLQNCVSIKDDRENYDRRVHTDSITDEDKTVALLKHLVKNSEESLVHLEQMKENTSCNPYRKRLSAEWDLLSKVAARSCFCLFFIAVCALSIEFALVESSPSRLHF